MAECGGGDVCKLVKFHQLKCSMVRCWCPGWKGNDAPRVMERVAGVTEGSVGEPVPASRDHPVHTVLVTPQVIIWCAGIVTNLQLF